ncbi:MAG TPA: hypothetical protein VK335_20550 [Bryobacteraceae bacterium]|nr:hypothetical protein [Bryobacteraceae bacterium]
MALFTDTLISTLDQLAAQDTAVLDVASAEGIDVTAKLSLAQNEVGAELLASGARSPFSPTSSSIWWPGIILTSNLQLGSIVVTPPLQMWHTFRTLELIYRDAYYNQLNDRYLGKWNAYKDLSKWAAGLLLQTGVGIVADPVPIAQSPQINIVPGTLSAASYYVQISWVNSRAEEGLASPITSVAAPGNSSVQVTPSSPSANATEWNVYVGASIDSISLQNTTPIVTNQPWILPTGGLVFGRTPGTGQVPNYFRQLPRYLQRG